MDKLMGSDLNDKSSITELWKASYVHPCVSHETPVCAEFANCFLKEINNLLTVKQLADRPRYQFYGMPPTFM